MQPKPISGRKEKKHFSWPVFPVILSLSLPCFERRGHSHCSDDIPSSLQSAIHHHQVFPYRDSLQYRASYDSHLSNHHRQSLSLSGIQIFPLVEHRRHLPIAFLDHFFFCLCSSPFPLYPDERIHEFLSFHRDCLGIKNPQQPRRGLRDGPADPAGLSETALGSKMHTRRA